MKIPTSRATVIPGISGESQSTVQVTNCAEDVLLLKRYYKGSRTERFPLTWNRLAQTAPSLTAVRPTSRALGGAHDETKQTRPEPGCGGHVQRNDGDKKENEDFSRENLASVVQTLNNSFIPSEFLNLDALQAQTGWLPHPHRPSLKRLPEKHCSDSVSAEDQLFGKATGGL